VSDGVGSLESCKTVNEAYAVRRTVPPLAEMEQGIDGLLAGMTVGEDPQGRLSELAKLGAGMRHSWRLRGWGLGGFIEPTDGSVGRVIGRVVVGRGRRVTASRAR
jgi:hypothetical protein